MSREQVVLVSRLSFTVNHYKKMSNKGKKHSPWAWVPSLYFAEGFPYVAVMLVAAIFYKRMGLSNTDIALYTGWLNLPWVIKPLWSPFVDIIKSKRWWIIAMQLLIGTALAALALTIPTTFFFQATFALFFLIAFSSATHDIACDGFYMIALEDHEQAAFIGIRNTFYRIAMIVGQGGLVMLAGYFETELGSIVNAWSIIFFVFAAIVLLLFIFHKIILPKEADRSTQLEVKKIFEDFGETFVSYFKKGQIWVALFFIFAYRFAEAQLNAIGKLFMLDPISKGGLGLTTENVGFLYGAIAVVFLLLGGIIGGIAIAKKGLKFWLWPMALAITLPNITYWYLAYSHPDNFYVITSCVALEQFGYGFGFTSFMMYLIYFSEGKFKTAHYAISTGVMALGMMLPTMVAGKLQEWMGYTNFFGWVMFSCVFTFIAVSMIKVESSYGKKISD